MKKFTTTVLLFLFYLSILPASNDSQIIETVNFEDVLETIDQETLLLLDIDQTLIESHYDTIHWYYYLRNVFNELNSNSEKKIQNKDLFSLLNNFVAKNVPVSLIEEISAQKIAELQSQNIIVLGLTTRGKSLWLGASVKNVDQFTKAQLNSVGIFLEKTESPFSEIAPNEAHGVHFTARKKKGDYLLELFQKTTYRPSRIVFIDDKLDQLESVKEVADQLNIPFRGYHYTRLEKLPANFDPHISIIQLIHLVNYKILLTYEEALLKKENLKESEIIEQLHNLLQMLDEEIHRVAA